jgi:transposase-like protein
MPRNCTICVHLRRDEINRRIDAGASVPSIAREFGLKESTGYRHKAHYQEAKASAPTGSTHAGDVSQLEFLQARDIELAKLQEQATTRGYSAAACQIVRERRQIGESIEKLRIAADAEVSVKATGTLTIALLDAIVNGDFGNES